MAAYCRVYGVIHFVTCGLTACTPGSAPGPTLGDEYGKTLPFTSKGKEGREGAREGEVEREGVTYSLARPLA